MCDIIYMKPVLIEDYFEKSIQERVIRKIYEDGTYIETKKKSNEVYKNGTFNIVELNEKLKNISDSISKARNMADKISKLKKISMEILE